MRAVERLASTLGRALIARAASVVIGPTPDRTSEEASAEARVQDYSTGVGREVRAATGPIPP
jgi:hypothetical protein